MIGFIWADCAGWFGCKEHGLPWERIPGDMKHFREVTTSNVAGKPSQIENMVVMGYNTAMTLPGPLPKRDNYVLCNGGYDEYSGLTEPGFHPIVYGDGTRSDIVGSLRVLDELTKVPDVWVIGGARIFGLLFNTDEEDWEGHTISIDHTIIDRERLTCDPKKCTLIKAPSGPRFTNPWDTTTVSSTRVEYGCIERVTYDYSW